MGIGSLLFLDRQEALWRSCLNFKKFLILFRDHIQKLLGFIFSHLLSIKILSDRPSSKLMHVLIGGHDKSVFLIKSLIMATNAFFCSGLYSGNKSE